MRSKLARRLAPLLLPVDTLDIFIDAVGTDPVPLGEILQTVDDSQRDRAHLTIVWLAKFGILRLEATGDTLNNSELSGLAR